MTAHSFAGVPPLPEVITIPYSDHPILQQDLQQLADAEILRELPEYSTVLITGATGLIGSQIAKALACHSKQTGKKLSVIAMVRNEDKARRLFSGYLEEGLIQLYISDISVPLCPAEQVDYIFHCASPTGSRFFVQQPAETAAAAWEGTRNVLEYARLHAVRKVVFLSSLEIYGTTDPSLELVNESVCGHLDPMQARSSYSEGKRMAECLCACYHQEYGVPVSVARLTQIFGAGVPYNEGKVFAEFARCAIEGRNIILHSKGNTVRNYCYTADTVLGLFYILLRGIPGEAYNVANMDTAVSIREMAELVCSLFPEKDLRLVFDIPEDISALGYNPERIIRLDSSKLLALGWKPSTGLKEMFTRMIPCMAANRGNPS